MLSRGDTVVYKCRGIYKVEEIGTLDFSFANERICCAFVAYGMLW